MTDLGRTIGSTPRTRRRADRPGLLAGVLAGLVVVVCLLRAAPVAAAEMTPVEQRLLRSLKTVDPVPHMTKLASVQSRVTGYPGCEDARKYIEERFRQLGLMDVKHEPFQITVPFDHGASLRVGGKEVRLYCCWPNSARTSQTDPGGLNGKLIWGDQGYFGDFNNKAIKGSIVLMRFNTATRWLNAAQLGARAIIFLEPDSPFRSEAEQKYIEVPVAVQRYYLKRTDAVALAQALAGPGGSVKSYAEALAVFEELGLKRKPTVRVDARMTWEEKTVYMVSGVIPGNNPEYRNRVYVYHSYYDALSVVPALAPGAESTIGVATLLETARVISENPPACSIKFLAVPGHFQALAGMRNYTEKVIFPKRLLPSDAQRRAGEPDFTFGLDLSSQTSSLAAFFKGHFYDQYGAKDEIRLQRLFAGFNTVLLNWSDELAREERGGVVAKFQSGIVPREGRDWSSLLPGRWAFGSEVVSLCGRPALTLATTGDDRSTIGTPLDTMDRFSQTQKQNVRLQAQMAAYLLARTATIERIPLQGRPIDLGMLGDVMGKAIERNIVSYLPNIPVSDSIVSAEIGRGKSFTGVSGKVYVRSDDRGFFRIFGLPTRQDVWVTGYKLDPRTGVVNMIGIPGSVRSTIQSRKRAGEDTVSDIRVPFFRCASTVIYDLLDPLSYTPLLTIGVYDGASNSPMRPTEMVKILGQQSGGSSYSEPVAVIFTEPDVRIKVTLSVGQIGNAGLLLDSIDNDKQFTGIGYPADRHENSIDMTSYRIARDMAILNQHRLAILKRTGIRKENVVRLHSAAETELKSAERALANKQYDEFYRRSRRAWALEKRVYPDIRGTADDAVRGVIFYFAILLPFVVFLERLLVNFPDIRAKLTAIGIIFVLSYGVLSLVHPAFRLSKTPVIILIGFFMCAVGLFIIGLLLVKFQAVTEDLRQRIATIHRADVARASAAMAAFILGISNMRKRKVRTLLTCITLILLTFTILSFTSFESLPASLVRYRSKYESSYNGVLIRRLSWDPVQESAFYDIRNFFNTQGFKAALRSWFVSADKAKELEIGIKRADTKDTAHVSAVAMLGLSPEERYVSRLQDYVTGKQWFQRSEPGYPFVCILPSRMAEMLQIDRADVGKAAVDVMGKRLRVIGIIDSDELGKWRDLDREPITPVDFVEQQFKQMAGGQEGGKASFTATGAAEEFTPETEESESELYIHMEPDRVLVVPNELVIGLGGSLRSVAIAARTQDEVESILSFYDVLRQYAERVSLALYAGIEGHLYRLATRTRLSMGGMKALIVPIFIAALIVFNTMLGAVYERKNEIKIYASVGLAPVHIASLFFAESSVFAVIGAMSGYLLGQTISRILVNFPSLMEGMSLNYSSMSAVWSAVLVILVVLLSTAYPAKLAASLSVPDETRKMVLAKPTSDEWNIVFPFTVSSYESLGVMTFLREYFTSHDEDSIGAFSAAEIEFYRKPEGKFDAYGLEAMVWVAPLDMGISQRVRIVAKPDPEEPVIAYLNFTLWRKSGEFETWHRMNMGFLKDLRKQLLIWRLVTPEEKERLKAEGLALIEGRALPESSTVAAEDAGAGETKEAPEEEDEFADPEDEDDELPV